MVNEHGFVHVRKSKRIIDADTGKQIAPDMYHRYVLEPDVDVSTEIDSVKSICRVVWTPEVVDKFKAKKQAESKKEKSGG